MKGSQEAAAVQIGGVFLADDGQILTVMPETATLPDRGFIINIFYAANKIVVELSNPGGYAAALGPTNILARLLRETLPPSREVGGGSHRQIVGVHVKPEAWFGFWKL